MVEPLTDAFGVRPFDWVQALMADPVLVETAALRAAWALLRYAPGKSRATSGWSFFVSERDLADLAQCSQPTIRRGMAALTAAGWVHRVSRGGGVKRQANTYALRRPGTPLSRERCSGEELRSPMSGNDGSTSELSRQPGRDVQEVQGGGELTNSAQNDSELRSKSGLTPLTGEHPVEKYSVEKYPVEYFSVEIASRSTATRSTPSAELLPDDWKPNRTHKGIMRHHGLNPDDVGTLAEEFKAAMTSTSQRRREWDPTFAAFIKSTADDRAAVEFATGT